MTVLREYQQRAIDQLYAWFEAGNRGNPCLVLPTGAGKSHIVAALCKDALQNWPETRVLMLTHVKELIQQNAEKMRQHWPNAPLGIYSAGLKRKELGEPITFAGIQSIRTKAQQLGHIDLCIVDECFVAGTKISTPTGHKDIDLVRCGDTLYNAQGVGVVLAVSAKPSSDIYKLEFSDGTVTECTGSHPFFTDQGWKQARELENGTYFFSIEGLRMLWSSIPSLDQEKLRNSENHFGLSRNCMEQARMLLSILCKEIEKPNEQPSVTHKNEGKVKGNQAQTYQAWRERAVAAFGTVGATSRAGGWMGSGIGDSYKNASSWNRFSDLLQSGFGESVNEDCHRTGRSKSLQLGKKSARLEKNRFFDFPRLERISRIESKGARTVFNIQVSGHPSYFADGKLVHNCHLIGHNDQGGYRTLLAELLAINPALRVIGLTASPYRLGHGYITDKPAIFDALIEPVSIEELVFKGYLSTLRSKLTTTKLETDGVHKRGGEYIESELQAAVDTSDKNQRVVSEIISLAGNRQSWLIFCAGVNHAQHVCDALRDQGIHAQCVTGETPATERDQILTDFKAGKIRALTNANVLTTGFDAPGIDLIAMLRPTMSPGLYLQMAGRGLRIAPNKTDCMVLDFAGVVEQHGPITAIKPPPKKGDKQGEAPVKVCDQCQEICHLSVRVCPACGNAFPEPQRPALKLSNLDIMGVHGIDLDVSSWTWRKHISRASGKEMLSVTYYGGLSDSPVTEYLAVTHDGYAGEKSRRLLAELAHQAGVIIDYSVADLHQMAQQLTAGRPPSAIEYKKEGKFFTVIKRHYATP